MMRVAITFLVVVTSGTAYARERDSGNQAVDSLAVEIVGDTVSVWDFGAYENCNCMFVTAVTKVGDTLNITQTDVEPVVARCNCVQDMRASITGLPAGAYTAVVYRDLRVKFPALPVILVGAVQFELFPAGSGAFAFWGYQSGCLTDVDEPEVPEQPLECVLMPAYPNPFNPSTKIRFTIADRRLTMVSVYDLLGREVATLVNEVKDPGTYEVAFDASGLASGVYLYQLRAGAFMETRRLVIVR